MFQFTDEGKINDIRGNVDVNEMDLDVFKSIDSRIVLTGDKRATSKINEIRL